MSVKNQTSQRVSDEAIAKATGKNWLEWFAVLDQAGCEHMAHQEIVAHLTGQCSVPGWWSQMVAVGYEQARGLREVHQKPEGFEISVSRTITVGQVEIFNAWLDNNQRRVWLKEKISVIQSTPYKSIRAKRHDDTMLEIAFYIKDDNKTQIVIQHAQLADAKAAEEMKMFWAKVLSQMKAALNK